MPSLGILAAVLVAILLPLAVAFALVAWRAVRRARAAESRGSLNEAVLEALPEGVLVHEEPGHLTFRNQAANEILGLGTEPAPARDPLLVLAGAIRENGDAFSEQPPPILALRTGMEQFAVLMGVRGADESTKWISLNSRAVARPDAPERRIAVTSFRDVTRPKAEADSMRHRMLHDPLTGLANRVLAEEQLVLELAHAERSKRMLAVMFLDLDGFKEVNDTLGHAAGDWLLTQVAVRLRRVLRSSDTIARLSGDEFLIILPQIRDYLSSDVVARKLCEHIAEPYFWNGKRITVTVSVGIALYPDNGSMPDELLRVSDAAMYVAKHQGRNSYRFHEADLNDAAARRRELQRQLRLAVDSGSFELYYQPRVGLSSGQITGGEALIRWRREDGTSHAPGEFLAEAEATGLMIPIADWVTREVGRYAGFLSGHGLSGFPLSMNYSRSQFEQPGLPGRMKALLEETGLSGEGLAVELTEDALMNDPQTTTENVRGLKDLGVQIAVDDFGRGFSSFSLLRNLPLDIVKIHSGFVQGIPQSPRDMAMTAAVIAMAQKLNVRTVAAGVETAEQRSFLQESGCDEMQGYLFSHPLPAAELPRFVQAHARSSP